MREVAMIARTARPDPQPRAAARAHAALLARGLAFALALGSTSAQAQAPAQVPGVPVPSQGPSLKVDYDKDAPFSRYKTYAWLESPARAENLANHIRITRAVEKELSGRGLVLDTSGRPDVFVRYIAKIETKVRGSSRKAGSPWEPTDLRTIVDIERVKQGTLIIEMLDGETRDVVWRAVGSDAVARVDLIEDQINTSVAKMLAQYPPDPEAPSPQP
jgi:hypothetical protein